MKKKQSILLLCLLATSLYSFPQTPGKVKINKITSNVQFDGKVDEAVWSEATKVELMQYRPGYAVAPTEKSDVFIGYDDKYLWLAGRLYMKDASKISATTKSRDVMPESSDNFGILIDGFNDKETALTFFTTPSGSRFDEALSGDAATGGGAIGGVWKNNWENITWNTFWDMKTTHDNGGWYVEMRIPFSSLKFKPSEQNISTMGFIIRRTIASKAETDTWPLVDEKFGNVAFHKASQAQEIEIYGAKPSNPIYVTPYVSAGNTRSYSMNSEGTAYERNSKWDWGIGGDVKYNINSKLTLDVTINPDFAQAEADDQQVNLTRYTINMAEKRSFFQERSSLFDFVLDGASNLFYSRNIGLNAEAQEVTILGGARLTGRIGKWDVGIMDMQTTAKGNLGAENFGVIRMRRNVINKWSYLGGMVNSRIGNHGQSNFAYGVDYVWRIFGDEYITAKVAQTVNDGDASRFSIHNTFANLMWEHRQEKNLMYKINYWYAGEQFNPLIGYLQRSKMQMVNGLLQYGFMFPRESKWFQFTPSIEHKRYERLTDGQLESATTTAQLQLTSKKRLQLSISGTYDQEGVQNKYFVSAKEGVLVNAGKYDFWYTKFQIELPKTFKYYFNSSIQYGGFYDGTQINWTFAPRVNLSKSLQLQGSYQINRIEFKDRDMSTTLHNVGFKALYMLDTKWSFNLYTQYQSKLDNMSTNFRVHYNPKEGSDFYIVFNDDRYFKRFDNGPIKLPAYNSSTVMFKYTYTFML